VKNENIRIEEPIDLAAKRCWTCGSFWAVDRWKTGECSFCPVCAKDEIRKAQRRADKAERVANALRGALKRAKRGKG